MVDTYKKRNRKNHRKNSLVLLAAVFAGMASLAYLSNPEPSQKVTQTERRLNAVEAQSVMARNEIDNTGSATSGECATLYSAPKRMDAYTKILRKEEGKVNHSVAEAIHQQLEIAKELERRSKGTALRWCNP